MLAFSPNKVRLALNAVPITFPGWYLCLYEYVVFAVKLLPVFGQLYGIFSRVLFQLFSCVLRPAGAAVLGNTLAHHPDVIFPQPLFMVARRGRPADPA